MSSLNLLFSNVISYSTVLSFRYLFCNHSTITLSPPNKLCDKCPFSWFQSLLQTLFLKTEHTGKSEKSHVVNYGGSLRRSVTATELRYFHRLGVGNWVLCVLHSQFSSRILPLILCSQDFLSQHSKSSPFSSPVRQLNLKRIV